MKGCGCEWHSGDQGAVVTICPVGAQELRRETKFHPLSEWELRRARGKEMGRRERPSVAEQKRNYRRALKNLPESTKDAMRAYASRKAAQEKEVSR